VHSLLYDIVASHGWQSISRYGLIDIIPRKIILINTLCCPKN